MKGIDRFGEVWGEYVAYLFVFNLTLYCLRQLASFVAALLCFKTTVVVVVKYPTEEDRGDMPVVYCHRGVKDKNSERGDWRDRRFWDMSSDCEQALSRKVIVYVPHQRVNRGHHFFVMDEDRVICPDLSWTPGNRGNVARLVVCQLFLQSSETIVDGYLFSRMTDGEKGLKFQGDSYLIMKVWLDVTDVMAMAVVRALDHDLVSLEKILGSKWDAYKALSRAKHEENDFRHR